MKSVGEEYQIWKRERVYQSCVKEYIVDKLLRLLGTISRGGGPSETFGRKSRFKIGEGKNNMLEASLYTPVSLFASLDQICFNQQHL